jgi:hypothetical protein
VYGVMSINKKKQARYPSSELGIGSETSRREGDVRTKPRPGPSEMRNKKGRKEQQESNVDVADGSWAGRQGFLFKKILFFGWVGWRSERQLSGSVDGWNNELK